MIRRIPHAFLELRRLHHTAGLSTDEILSLQWGRFRQLIRHAFANSRFYREKWSRAGVQPDAIRTREDLSLIPITTRDELGDQGDLIVDSAARDGLRWSLSSGTTGQWTKSFFDTEAWIMGKYLLKARARLLCGMRPWDRVAVFHFGGPTPTSRGQRLLRQRRYSIEAPCKSVLPSLLDFSPTVLYGFPSYLSQLAAVAGGSLAPRLVFTSGELLDTAQRTELERAFGVEVMDIYGCTELKEVSWQCSDANQYHVNADWLLVESVDSEGTSIREDGNLVITSLYNRAMPLIRYQVGDTGRLIDGGCRCGLGLPLMSPTRGRTDDYLRAGDGSRVSPMSARSVVAGIAGVRFYQIVQQHSGSVVLKVVPHDPDAFDQKRSLQTQLSDVLKRSDVEVSIVESIPREPNGKFRFVVSDA